MVRLGEVNPAIYEDTLSRLENILHSADLEEEYEEFNWRKTANRRKFDRQLFERYGYLKDLVLHPKFQHVKHYLEEHADLNVFVGEPLLPTTTAVIILFLMNKRVSNNILGLSALLIFNVNPLYVAIAAIVLWLLSSGRTIPKQHRPVAKVPHSDIVDETINAATGTAPLPRATSSDSSATISYDHILIGSDLSTLYTAALLAKNGHRCCVLQPTALGPQFEVRFSPTSLSHQCVVTAIWL
jgi:hypothetical protein